MDQNGIVPAAMGQHFLGTVELDLANGSSGDANGYILNNINRYTTACDIHSTGYCESFMLAPHTVVTLTAGKLPLPRITPRLNGQQSAASSPEDWGSTYHAEVGHPRVRLLVPRQPPSTES